MTGNLFCFGLGYCGTSLARRMRNDGWCIAGTTRDEGKAVALEREGFDIRLFDGSNCSRQLKDAVERADAILVSIPPDGEGDPTLRAAGTTLQKLATRWRWLGYLSSTGVYGDRKGDWVDEATPPAPNGPRAVRRLAAEVAWRNFAARTGAPLHIFRMAGIYGPGRSSLDSLRAGTARRFDKPGHTFSRVHVDDVALVLSASIARPSAGAIYNVCDDEPASQAEVIEYGARLLQIAPPPLEPFSAASGVLSDMARSFHGDSKRVRNDKIKSELGVHLAYPSYRDGLAGLIASK